MTIEKKRKRASAKSEKAVAERLGGRRIAGSGCGLEKADGRVRGKYRIENKITAKSSYRLTFDDWIKLWTAASNSGEMPVFHVKMASEIVGTTEVVVIPAEQAPYSSATFYDHKERRGYLLSSWMFERRNAQRRFSLTGRYQDAPKKFALAALPYDDFLTFVEAREDRDNSK